MSIIGRIHDAYGDALKYIADLMKDNGIEQLNLKYEDYTLPPAYNINDWDGNAHPIVNLTLDSENVRGLIGYDKEGTEFYLGRDMEDQDNYTLVGIQNLVSASVHAINEIMSHCIELPQGVEREAVIAAIKKKISPDGEIVFDHGFAKPVFIEDCICKEVITKASSKEITTQRPDGTVRQVLLESMTRKELLSLATGINDYVKYIHNISTNHPCQTGA
jgi:hypothetical protein